MANAYAASPLPAPTKPNTYLLLAIAVFALIIGYVLRLKYSSGEAAMIITASGNETGSVIYIILSFICFGLYFFLIMLFSTKWNLFNNRSLANSLAWYFFPAALLVAVFWFGFLLSYDGSPNKYNWWTIWAQIKAILNGQLHEGAFLVTLVLFFCLSSALIFNVSVCFAMVGRKCDEQAEMYQSAQNFIFLSSAAALLVAILYAILLFNTQTAPAAPAATSGASVTVPPAVSLVGTPVQTPSPPMSFDASTMKQLECKTFLKQYFEFGIVYGIFSVCLPLFVLFVFNLGSLGSFASGIKLATKFVGFAFASAGVSEGSGIVLLSIPASCRNDVLTVLPYIASGLRWFADLISKMG